MLIYRQPKRHSLLSIIFSQIKALNLAIPPDDYIYKILLIIYVNATVLKYL